MLQILVDMLSYYKHQARMLVWIVVIVLTMHLATVIGFLYYESQFETTTTTTTTTQTVDGKDNDIVNGDKVNGNQYNDKAQNKGVVNNVSDTDNNDNNSNAKAEDQKQ